MYESYKLRQTGYKYRDDGLTLLVTEAVTPSLKF